MNHTKALRCSTLILLLSLLLVLCKKSSAQIPVLQDIQIPKTRVLFIYGNVPQPIAISIERIQSMPQITVTAMDSSTNKSVTYSGVAVKDLLIQAGVPADSKVGSVSLVAINKDGSQINLSSTETATVFSDKEKIIVADGANGKPLDTSNGPLMLILSGENEPAHSVRNLARIQVHTAN